MDFELNDEQRMIRDAVRRFAQEQVAPLAQHTDETGEFPAAGRAKRVPVQVADDLYTGVLFHASGQRPI